MRNLPRSNSRSQLKKIPLTELTSVLQRLCQMSFVSRSATSSSYDFDRCLPYLTERGLQEHIIFVSGLSRRLPLNSDRHVYDINNIIIRKLHIQLNDRQTWAAYDDWQPLAHSKWHFESCDFDASGSNMYSMHFPWSGSFRFYKNDFGFRSHSVMGYWLFVFQNGSRVVLQRNNFRNHHIQTRCIPQKGAVDESDSIAREVGDVGGISFIGNRAISSLDILEGYSSVSFTGMNQIDRLWFARISETIAHDDGSHGQQPVVYFGPREKIDRHFHHCLQHRRLFLYLRGLAAGSHDRRQLGVLDKQIDRIEYFLNKEQDGPSVADLRNWAEYWQDRLLYAWRRWSSDFYRSWMRARFL